MKKIISLILSIIICLIAIPAYAEDLSISPYYIHIKFMTHEFSINTQTGYTIVDADMEIKSGSYCTIAAEVQHKENNRWVSEVTYRANGSPYAYFENDLYLDRGYVYKCVFTFTVYDEYDFIIEQKIFSSQEIDYT